MKRAALLLCTALAAAGCSRPKPRAAAFEPCSLLTADEIKAIQGAAPVSTTPVRQTDGGVTV
ncbi:MAG: hypothetical protein M3Y80_12055, partial [Verrucomicrobiota bacterium]|nr:hypothetical protein [Verrucomicrobiota bacterium]